MSRYVKIFYGPCESFESVCHKPQKLKGLRDTLQYLGFRVDFVPVEYVNYCVIEMCGHEIFRCNIQNLSFNLPSTHDPVCQRAINAVIESETKLQRANDYFWLWHLIDSQIFTRSKHAPVDHWPCDVTTEQFGDLIDCIKCCGILVKKRNI